MTAFNTEPGLGGVECASSVVQISVRRCTGVVVKELMGAGEGMAGEFGLSFDLLQLRLRLGTTGLGD